MVTSWIELIDNANYVGLIPARIYDEKVVQNEDKVINFYISKGFKPISRRLGGDIIMGESLLYSNRACQQGFQSL